MQKTSKNFDHNSRYSSHHPTMSVTIVDTDVLGVMIDDEIINRLQTLEDEKTIAYERGYDVKPWEEEIAYVRREMQIRRRRRDLHVEFMKKNEDETFVDESAYPSGDFDNSAFVYAATNGKPRWN